MRRTAASAARAAVCALAFAYAVSACHSRDAPTDGAVTLSWDAALTLHGTPCGLRDCASYTTPQDALNDLLAADPLVLAIGEAHAPADARAPSAARRFTSTLLPLLAGRASDLLLELMLPPNGCARTTQEARTNERPITSQQSPEGQTDYLAMGDAARPLGVIPDLLRPTCRDLEDARGDGDDPVGPSLRMIARLTLAQAKSLVVRDARSEADRGKMVVVYGGLLHNDLAPPPEKASFSYAPELAAFVDGRLLSLDLIVPEFIRDDSTWRALPWYSAYDAHAIADRTTVFRTGARSFVLVFARSTLDGG